MQLSSFLHVVRAPGDTIKFRKTVGHIQETLGTKLPIAKEMAHVKSFLLKRSVTGRQEDTVPPFLQLFACAPSSRHLVGRCTRPAR